MNYSPGEIADKLTITCLKMIFSDDKFIHVRFQTEVKKLMKEWKAFLPRSNHWDYLFTLQSANLSIWRLESDIRNGNLKDLEEIGRRAIRIRELNRTRISLKNEIDKDYGIPPEVKIDHVSEKRNNDDYDPTAD
jgi:hypothetical protein